LTFTSATGAATFSAPVSVFGSTGTEVNFALNQSGVGQWSFRNIATSGDLRLSIGGNDWFSIVRTTGAATFTNTLSVSATTASTSTTTGSLVNAGGFGNVGAAYIGGPVSTGSRFVFTGPGALPGASELAIGTNGVGTRILSNVPTGGEFNFTVNGTTVTAINATTGLYTTGLINSTNTTASTSTTTGSLVNAGGFGNAGAIFAGSTIASTVSTSGGGVVNFAPANSAAIASGNTANIHFSTYASDANTWQLTARQNSTTPTDKTLRVILGGVAQHTYFNASDLSTQSGIQMKVLDTTTSTSTTTGALVVGSNVGLSGNSGGANWFGGERLISQMNQNAPTRLQVRNDTSGTAAQAQVSATLGDFTTYTAMGSLSAGFTTSGLFAANTGYIASNATAGLNIFTAGSTSLILGTNSTAALTIASTGAATFSNSVRSTSATGGIGYGTGAGGAVTQGTSRTTGVTLNTVAGAITLFTAAGSATWQSFTVTNSAVAATDTIIVNQRSGTDLYMMSVTAVGAGSFRISFATTGGTTSEAPVFNFSVIKAVSA
jgi:hypothetical protein